ncbi:MAG TPA: hypothetical protein PLB89_03660 [Flavobacteriales bacterium]|nr:hypothetical protein [Flavobacteriales bacterium]
MKDMKHRYAMLFLAFGTGSIQAQQIDFDQGNWQSKDLGTRAMQMVVQRAVRDLHVVPIPNTIRMERSGWRAALPVWTRKVFP